MYAWGYYFCSRYRHWIYIVGGYIMHTGSGLFHVARPLLYIYYTYNYTYRHFECALWHVNTRESQSIISWL